MQKRITYCGELNGVKGLWCGFKPKGLTVEKEIEVFYADEGKVFEKDGETFTSVVLKDGEKIGDYQEVEAPKEEEKDGDKCKEIC